MLKRLLEQIKQAFSEEGQDSKSPSPADTFRASLISALKNPPPDGVCVDDYIVICGVSQEIASQVCDELYLAFARKVASDGKISVVEHEKLDRLAATLSIGRDRAAALERVAAEEVYQNAVREVLADGVVTPDEAAHLASIRRSLGLDENAGPAWIPGNSTNLRSPAGGAIAPAPRISAEIARSSDREGIQSRSRTGRRLEDEATPR